MFKIDEVLLIVTNGRLQTHYIMGSLSFIPMFTDYSPDSLANILSFQYVESILVAQVTMDTEKERLIVAHLRNGYNIRFKE